MRLEDFISFEYDAEIHRWDYTGSLYSSECCYVSGQKWHFHCLVSGLKALSELVAVSPRFALPHQQVVMECLEHPNLSIQQQVVQVHVHNTYAKHFSGKNWAMCVWLFWFVFKVCINVRINLFCLHCFLAVVNVVVDQACAQHSRVVIFMCCHTFRRTTFCTLWQTRKTWLW